MTADPTPDFPFDRETPLEPPRQWAELREQCPVAHVRLPSGDQATLLTRYESVRAVLADPRFGRSGEGAARISTTDDGGLFNRDRGSGDIPTQGAGHQQWRRLLSRWFTARKVQEWQPRVQAMADDLVDGLIAGGSPANLSAGLGFPLPVRVICALVGAPDKDQDKFGHWSTVMLTLTRYSQAEVDEAYRDFDSYVSDLVERRRTDPGDDLLSDLIKVTDSGDGRLSTAQLVTTVRGILLAGHETTSNMISIMVAMLLSERDRFEAVTADPALIPNTVEEVLRLDTTLAVIGVPRFVTENIELDGVTVPAGTTVLPSTPAANRDPRTFPDPDRFDLERENSNRHLTFGTGAHFCVGQPLARMELQVVLSTLARRLPTLRLRDSADDLKLRTGGMSGGLQDIWVTW
ncbi:cytochrome P450 [Streptomyces sp. NBC_01429]|uniref:cytochrome P450 n=1 Tax=Streptomyces sp. NBC_01429 TaxID=2903862 RepID=UPI002E2CEA14|nr:cytochrome P450 [Streptomyces sp. NBC_01429]